MNKVICFNDPVGNTGFLSNRYISFFQVGKYGYFTMEQYIAHQKALTFGDPEIAEKVMCSGDFEEMKALGRQVRNYDNRVWNGQNLLGFALMQVRQKLARA